MLVLSIFTLASSPARAQTEGSSRVLQLTPYTDPFAGHHGFVEFMKTSPFATPPWTDDSLHAAFPPKLYERCFDSKHTLVAEVIYESPHGTTRGWMLRPLDFKGQLPVVVYNRGGLSWWGKVKHIDIATLCRIALRGYMVLASDFRGVPGLPGKQDTDDLGHDDVLDSFYFLDAVRDLYPDTDVRRLAVWGFSRGTSISVMMATRSQDIKLLILQGTVSDSVDNPRREMFEKRVYPLVVENWSQLSKSTRDRLLAEISPKRLIDRISHRPTFAFFQGGLDWRTPSEDALRLSADLVARKFPVEFHLYPNTGHVLSGRYSQYLSEVIRILDKTLKSPKSP